MKFSLLGIPTDRCPTLLYDTNTERKEKIIFIKIDRNERLGEGRGAKITPENHNAEARR